MAIDNESSRDENASTAVQDVRRTVASGAEAVQHRVKARAETLSSGVGERAAHIAEALRSAGEQLRGREDWLAEAADGLSRNLDSFSNSAREKGFDGLRQDVERMARQRPAMFIGASVAAGLALGRLLRSHPPGQDAAEDQPATSHHTANVGSMTSAAGQDTRAAASPAYASAQPEAGRYETETGRQGDSAAASPAYPSAQPEGGRYGPSE